MPTENKTPVVRLNFFLKRHRTYHKQDSDLKILMVHCLRGYVRNYLSKIHTMFPGRFNILDLSLRRKDPILDMSNVVTSPCKVFLNSVNTFRKSSLKRSEEKWNGGQVVINTYQLFYILFVLSY